MPKFAAQIDTSQIPIKTLVIEQGTSFPASPVVGQKFFRTDIPGEYVCTVGGGSPTWIRADVGGVASASTTVAGIIRIATTAESNAGADDTVAMTPAKVKARIDALINAAPGALDTLAELATALGGDANFATTVTNALAGKAPLVHVHSGSDITSGAVGIAQGGTGASTAAGARTALGAAAVTIIIAHGALVAGTWLTLTHTLNTPAKEVVFIDSNNERVILDWRQTVANLNTQIDIKADKAYAANSFTMYVFG